MSPPQIGHLRWKLSVMAAAGEEEYPRVNRDSGVQGQERARATEQAELSRSRPGRHFPPVRRVGVLARSSSTRSRALRATSGLGLSAASFSKAARAPV